MSSSTEFDEESSSAVEEKTRLRFWQNISCIGFLVYIFFQVATIIISVDLELASSVFLVLQAVQAGFMVCVGCNAFIFAVRRFFLLYMYAGVLFCTYMLAFLIFSLAK